MLVWRLTSAKHADAAFSGVGTREYGSRWVPAGHLAVYTSASLSLAVLENLVHMEPRHFGDRFVQIPASIPDDLVPDQVDVTGLPEDWPERFEDGELHAVGLDWLRRGDSVMLVVPSSVVPTEHNIILNPRHPDFERIEIGDVYPFRFDGRLTRGQ